MKKRLPCACRLAQLLDLQALEVIAKEVLSRCQVSVEKIENDESGMHEHISAEVDKLWASIDPAQIAYVVKTTAETEWKDPEEKEYYYNMSIEDIIIDCADEFLCQTIDDIVEECMGPGESCDYSIDISTYDEAMQANMMREICERTDGLFDGQSNEEDLRHQLPKDGSLTSRLFNAIFSEDDDNDDDDLFEEEEEYEEVVIARMLGKSKWSEKHFIKGYVLEVTGENAAIYIDNDGEEKLAIPKILQLLNKVKKASPGKWYEHKPGWKYRIVKEKMVKSE